jgi:hypothetical protein
MYVDVCSIHIIYMYACSFVGMHVYMYAFMYACFMYVRVYVCCTVVNKFLTFNFLKNPCLIITRR